MTDTLIKGNLDPDTQRENACDDGGGDGTGAAETIEQQDCQCPSEARKEQGRIRPVLGGIVLTHASLSDV